MLFRGTRPAILVDRRALSLSDVCTFLSSREAHHMCCAARGGLLLLCCCTVSTYMGLAELSVSVFAPIPQILTKPRSGLLR